MEFSAPHSDFVTTRWTAVLTAGEESPEGREALAQLCARYWYPLYAYVRRKGHSSPDAEDLTQEFFARLLEKRWLSEVRRDGGRFRAFLLGAMKHFLANEWDRSQALKRGGRCAIIALDGLEPEARYALEPIAVENPEHLFERRWAFLLLDAALTRLRAEFALAGKERQFDILKPALLGESASAAEIASELHLSEGAVKAAIHRLRERYRAAVREEIAQTVVAGPDIDAELEHLRVVLGGRSSS